VNLGRLSDSNNLETYTSVDKIAKGKNQSFRGFWHNITETAAL
jgi:hypothetical protein